MWWGADEGLGKLILQNPWSEKHLKSLSRAGRKKFKKEKVRLKTGWKRAKRAMREMPRVPTSKPGVQSLVESESITLLKGCGTA